MNGNGKLLTIKEAVQLSGKSESYIYKLIKKGAIRTGPVQDDSRTIPGPGQAQSRIGITVKEADIVSFFGISPGQFQDNSRTIPKKIQSSPVIVQSSPELKETIKEVISEYFEEKQTAIMKPLEDQAMFLAGKYEAENKFLKEKLEIVLRENEEFRTSIKALPGPPQEIATRLEEQYQQIQKTEEETKIFRKKAEELEKGQVELQQKQTQKEQEIEKLKATIKNQAEEAREKDDIIRQQKDHFQIEEKDYIATIEVLKMKLEEEQKKPWWKFW